MKKGFTLIELLAVIIILAVVALIATPIVLDVVKDTKESAAKSQAYMILDGAKLYYTESMFDNSKKAKLTGVANIYDEISMNGKKPENGKLYINKTGLVAMAVLINNKCYKKEFAGELQITEDQECDAGIANDSVIPTISLELNSKQGNVFNENGWANKDIWVDFNVTDNESGSYSYTWCSDNKECDPTNEPTEKTSGSFVISLESETTYACAYGYDLAGNKSEKVCVGPYKIDKQVPTLTAVSEDVSITFGDDNLVSGYFNVNYSISGGILGCNPLNTSSLTQGSQTVTCTAIGNNGLQTTSTKIIIVNKIEPNAPILFNKMIPVTWNGSSWVYADVNNKWYDYDLKEWANAVVLNDGVTKAVGNTILESEIAMMYVWIPRYKYTIFNGNNGSAPVQQINVVFENGTAKTGTVTCTLATSGSGSSSENCGTVTNGTSTYTHPAFTFGTKELTGIWVGKFENSAPSVESDTVQKVIIKPNVISWRSATVSKFYQSILNIKTDYSMSGIDSHMMKNMEWGAVAYLKQSKYGLLTTDIGINNNSNFTTGCGESAGSSETGLCNPYNTTNGMSASTTGNIYGIYDMSGGAYEYVMGNMVNSSNQFYSLNAGFSTSPPVKYYDSYTFDESSMVTHSRGRLGDATKETLKTYGNGIGGWYGDTTYFPYSPGSWMIRGGLYYNGSSAGVFFFNRNAGSGNSSYAARAVIVSE